jgi:Mg-chelatase subunit ChlD
MNTEILVITDRSGSMATIASDVIGGYNRLMADQKRERGEARVTYTQFDTAYEVIYAGKPLAEVPELTAETFVPRGGTALLDAIGRTLHEQGERIKREAWVELVVCVIITDGHENSSHEFSHARIKEMIGHAEKHGWLFIYVAANQNSFDEARGLGMIRGQSMTFDANAQGTADAYVHTNSVMSTARAGVMPAPQTEEKKLTPTP